MERSKLVKKVKEYFSIDELVCPHVFQRDGEIAWRYFSDAVLEQIVAIRELLDVPMIVNNYSNGGKYSQRGIRCNICSLTSSKTKAGVLYVTAHALAQAIDFHCPSMTAEEVRNILRKNADKLPYSMRMEKDVNWVHIDLYQVSDKKKITEFNG